MPDYSANPLMQLAGERMMAGNGEGMQYMYAPSSNAAKLILEQALSQGFRGYVVPLPTGGQHEIRIWRDPQMPSLGPANPYAKG